MGVRADQYLWFDGVEDVDQVNWGKYWRGFVTDGVITGFRDELRISANSSGMQVHAAAGEAMIYGVRVFLHNPKALPVEGSDPSLGRLDRVVARAVFLNEGQSYAELDIKKGTPAALPTVPDLTQQAAQIWEIPLAVIRVPAGASTIRAEDVFSEREYSGSAGSGSGITEIFYFGGF